MANICASCRVLSKGLLLGKRPTEKLLGSLAWQKRSFSVMVKQGQCLSPVSSSSMKFNFPGVKLCSSSRSLFIDSKRYHDDKRDPVSKHGGEGVSCSAAPAGGGGLSARSQTRTEEEEDYEDSLTEEERQVLREIEEEERRFREASERRLKDYSIWDRANISNSSDGQLEGDRSITGSLSQDHVPFQDQKRIIQDVIDEMWNPQPEEEEEEVPAILYPRGKTGVFDLWELVVLLEEEHGEEIVAIRIPPEFEYADSMVIVTVRNNRHLNALGTFVRKRFKSKELKPSDVIPHIEKKRSYQGWIALDMGNIILHVMLQEVRDYYDLEMLWTVGPQYDDLTHAQDPEIVQLLNTLK